MQPFFKSIFVCSILATLAPNSWGAITLTSFGSGSSPTFAVDGSTTFGTTQTSSNLNVVGADNSQVGGFFASKDISAESDFLILTGSTTLAPASSFTVELFDINFLTATYTGGAWSGLTGLSSGSTTLSFLISAPGFDFTKVVGLQLNGAGTGLSNVNATLTGASTLSAIPEPSRIVLMAIGCGGLLLRRRRSVRV